MEVDQIKRAIGPLQLVFWGGLICVIDITINQFDLLNDAVGTIMVACGVLGLAGIHVHNRYTSAMTFVSVIAVLSVVEAIASHFTYVVPMSPMYLTLLLILFGMAVIVAMVLFCIAMRWMCEEAMLQKSQQSWKTTTILFVAIYLIPLGLFYLVGAGAILTGESFHFDMGPAALLLIPVFLTPLVHLFVSTSRMKNEAVSVPLTSGIDQQDVAPAPDAGPLDF